MADFIIKGVNPFDIAPVGEPQNSNKAQGANNSAESFAKILKESIEKVNEVQADADQTIKDFVAGNKNIHETMIAVEKAGLSFQMMLQVRNKIITAYEEVMRMQV